MKPRSSYEKPAPLKLDDIMEFGKYKGLKVKDLAQNKPTYILGISKSRETCSEVIYLAIENLKDSDNDLLEDLYSIY